ncbi:hypothetical protein NX773_17925 [Massilia solisilvae]|uniref:Chemotaxis protein n=1 Tax=Massilia solisilvae TaxID=1811225 RepID=A0ABT2BNI4_9BURK|nr:hypothetical protein [Massilia solisilvae]MCS0610049.1 hypothetical protein [Massilia solisilvae]
MDRLETDTATVVGLWVGIASFLLGFAGIGLTLYSFYRASPDVVVLTASGWVAALLTSLTCGWVGKRLVSLAATLSNRVANLSAEVVELKAEKDRVVAISEYVAAQATRNTRRKQSPVKEEKSTQE